jgi:hypothetical protein
MGRTKKLIAIAIVALAIDPFVSVRMGCAANSASMSGPQKTKGSDRCAARALHLQTQLRPVAERGA